MDWTQLMGRVDDMWGDLDEGDCREVGSRRKLTVDMNWALDQAAKQYRRRIIRIHNEIMAVARNPKATRPRRLTKRPR